MDIGGENLRAHLAKKYGTSLEASIKARANLTSIGNEVGFEFNYFDDMKIFNTFKAHQLLYYARSQKKEHELKLRLFSAYFQEKKEIDQIKTLINEGVSVGLNKEEIKTIFEDQLYADKVRDEQNEWLTLGINSVPTFIINKKTMFSGAQNVDSFAKTLKYYL